MNIHLQLTNTKPDALTNQELKRVQGGTLDAPHPFDERTLRYQPWRNDQHVNSITSRKHTGYASKFNAMN